MKKRIYVVIMVFAISFTALSGCNNKEQEAPAKEISVEEKEESKNKQNPKMSEDIRDYYVFKENTVYKYVNPYDEQDARVTFTDHLKEDKDLYQVRTVTSTGAFVLEAFTFDGDKLIVKNGYSEIQGFIDITEHEPVEDGKFLLSPLQGPMKKGNKWISGEYMGNNINCEITNVGVEIKVPYGKFNTIEVTTTYENAEPSENIKAISQKKDYYAEGIGLVKVENYILSVDDDEPILLVYELAEVGENVEYTSNQRFFYPRITDTDYEIEIEDVVVGFKTNDSEIEFLEQGFKNPPSEDLMAIFDKETKINSIDYDYTNEVVYVDLSSDFLESLNHGSGFENAILQSIVNTLGVYYDVPHVGITIDGEGYSSEHLSFEKGELLEVYIEEKASDYKEINDDILLDEDNDKDMLLNEDSQEIDKDMLLNEDSEKIDDEKTE